MAKILVIDDMKGVQYAITSVLRRSGHDVDEADNGKHGIEMAQSGGYELVITDMLMPVAGGIEIISYLNQQSPRPKILAISGGGTNLPAEEALQTATQSVDSTLEKPFTKDQLLDAVGALLTDIAA